MRSLSFALVLVGCRPVASNAPTEKATIAFVAPPGSMRGWSFDVHGLPAIDLRTGEILVADAGRERLLERESVSLLSLRGAAPARVVTTLVDYDAMGDLHLEEDESQEARFRDEIAARVRESTRAANGNLDARALRPLVACHLPADAPMIFCTHPQTITCGENTFELEDDALRGRSASVRTGWQIAPMEIGDGPPKKMLACIEEAHLETVTTQLAVRMHQVCADGGSDACILRDEWHVLSLRRDAR